MNNFPANFRVISLVISPAEVRVKIIPCVHIAPLRLSSLIPYTDNLNR